MRASRGLSLIPGLFMTAVISTYLFLAPEGFHLSKEISYSVGNGITVLTLILFIIWFRNERNINSNFKS